MCSLHCGTLLVRMQLCGPGVRKGEKLVISDDLEEETLNTVYSRIGHTYASQIVKLEVLVQVFFINISIDSLIKVHL